MSSPEELRAQVALALGREADPGWDVVRLAGHASARTYFRVTGPDFRVIAMVAPADPRSEEASKGGVEAEDPFVQIQRYLRGLGIRVPAIHRWDPKARVMILEDLGSRTLEDALAESDAEALYQKAIDRLAALRARADRAPDPACVAFRRSFDFDLLRWEMDHFREWIVGDRFSAEDAARFAAEADALCRALDALPKGFTHRDYQSRNLMVLDDGDLAVIDFQDALQGTVVYDLVALLRDSYVELPLDRVERLILRYAHALREEGGETLDPEALVETFHLQTVQRKLKDAGRFVFIDRVKQNPSFLPYVKPSLGYVKAALERLPRLAPLHDLLARYVPELA
ncbi:MAG TPA: phosphotransferase [Fredinandcohnia sp.]|nr:phosphotransferase [Fredinandcohnia sp.]